MAKRLFAGWRNKQLWDQLDLLETGRMSIQKVKVSKLHLLNSDAAVGFFVSLLKTLYVKSISLKSRTSLSSKRWWSHTFILRMGSILVVYHRTEKDETFCKFMLLHKKTNKGLMGGNTWILREMSQQQEGQTFWDKPSVFLIFLWAENGMSVLWWTSVPQR